MKMFVATAIFAVAALAAPMAVGQSQGLALAPVNEMATGALQAVQAQAVSFFADRRAGGFDDDEPSAVRPDPSTSWLMALAILGLIVIRRTRSSSMR